MNFAVLKENSNLYTFIFLKFDKNSLMVKSNIAPFYRQLFFSSFVFFLANQTPHCASVNVSSIDENGSE